jgi:hypothetical protein
MHFRKQLAEAEANFANGLPPTKEIEEEWNHLQWRNEMMRRAYQKRSGFYREIQHKQGYQVNSEKIRAGCCKKKMLEDPKDSILGWRFSAESRDAAFRTTPMELTFNNSALNPRRSCISRRASSSNKSLTPVQSQQKTPLLFAE